MSSSAGRRVVSRVRLLQPISPWLRGPAVERFGHVKLGAHRLQALRVVLTDERIFLVVVNCHAAFVDAVDVPGSHFLTVLAAHRSPAGGWTSPVVDESCGHFTDVEVLMKPTAA